MSLWVRLRVVPCSLLLLVNLLVFMILIQSISSDVLNVVKTILYQDFVNIINLSLLLLSHLLSLLIHFWLRGRRHLIVILMLNCSRGLEEILVHVVVCFFVGYLFFCTNSQRLLLVNILGDGNRWEWVLKVQGLGKGSSILDNLSLDIILVRIHRVSWDIGSCSVKSFRCESLRVYIYVLVIFSVPTLIKTLIPT